MAASRTWSSRVAGEKLMLALDVRRACELAAQAAAQRWLIHGLWGESAVGIVGGEPKCCKSFLALAMAVSVAAGFPCLGRFAAPRRGPVLLYAAEGAVHIVRARLEGICTSVQVPLDSLDVHVIVDPVVRLRRRARPPRAQGRPRPRRPGPARLVRAARELRDICRLRNATLTDTLAALHADGRVRFDAGRVQLALV